jgi:hypothetical protein
MPANNAQNSGNSNSGGKSTPMTSSDASRIQSTQVSRLVYNIYYNTNCLGSRPPAAKICPPAVLPPAPRALATETPTRPELDASKLSCKQNVPGQSCDGAMAECQNSEMAEGGDGETIES